MKKSTVIYAIGHMAINKNLVAHINWKHKDREAYKCGSCELTFLYMKKTHGQDE